MENLSSRVSLQKSARMVGARKGKMLEMARKARQRSVVASQPMTKTNQWLQMLTMVQATMGLVRMILTAKAYLATTPTSLPVGRTQVQTPSKKARSPEFLEEGIKGTKEAIKSARAHLAEARKRRKEANDQLSTLKKNIVKAQMEKNRFCSLKRSEVGFTFLCFVCNWSQYVSSLATF